jgi:anaerobic ribonucleoside-triphosphate reductase activating protein
LSLLYYIDVLVDGPYIESQRTLELPWRGSRNQRLIDVQESLRQGKAVEYGGAPQ